MAKNLEDFFDKLVNQWQDYVKPGANYIFEFALQTSRA